MNIWEWIFAVGFFAIAAFVGLASHDGPLATASIGIPDSLTSTAEESINRVTDESVKTLRESQAAVEDLRREIRELRAGIRALEAGGDGLKEAGNSVSTSWELLKYFVLAGLVFLILLGLFVGYQAWRNRIDSHQTMLVTLKLAESMEAFKEAELSENKLQREMLDDRTS